MRTLGTGEIWIDCTGTNGNNVKSLLTDVHYIPDFHTNLISYDRLEMNGIYWDPRRKVLYTDDRDICKVHRMYGQRVVEYNPPSVAINKAHSVNTEEVPGIDTEDTNVDEAHAVSSKIQRESTATLDLWHKRLGHVNAEAIQHAVRNTRGVQLEGSTSTLSMCETCYLTEANRQISRFPIERSTAL